MSSDASRHEVEVLVNTHCSTQLGQDGRISTNSLEVGGMRISSHNELQDSTGSVACLKMTSGFQQGQLE